MTADIMVAISCRNRPNLMKLTTELLRPTERMVVFFQDDDSDDQRTLDYLSVQQWKNLGCVRHHPIDIAIIERDYHDRAMRLARLRRKTVIDFLNFKQAEWLVMKDDDILLSSETILEAIRDFEHLRSTEWSRIGGLTFHGLKSHYGGQLTICGPNGPSVFSSLQITGEAAVLFDRHSLEKAGNAFQPVRGGFADTQFEALRTAGLIYYDRQEPPFAVQHLGYGPGGSIIHQEHVPFWNEGPFRSTYRRRGFDLPIEVQGFDLQMFDEVARQRGGEEAAQCIIRQMNL